MRLDDGSPAPLGATWDGRGVNFALFSAHGAAVDLCLFEPGPDGAHEQQRVECVCGFGGGDLLGDIDTTDGRVVTGLG